MMVVTIYYSRIGFFKKNSNHRGRVYWYALRGTPPSMPTDQPIFNYDGKIRF